MNISVKDLAKKLDLEVVNICNEEAEVRGVCVGDLFSYVMAKAEQDDCWLTIMSNVNVAAVAKLTDMPCVIICDDVQPEDALLIKAKQQGITLFKTKKTLYQACVEISKL